MPTLLQRQGAQAELTEIWRDVAESGEQHIIRVQYVDFRHDHEPIENGVARFTTRNQSPSATGNILLRVPKYYRKLEDGDPLDGATKADVAPLVARHLTSTGVPVSASQVRAHGTLASPDEPWVLCTSIRPCHPEGANALERRFSDKGADAAVTTIADPGAFARQLGIDVARSPTKMAAAKDDVHAILSRHRLSVAFGGAVDTCVDVFHGPVHYEDSALTLNHSREMAKIDARRTWFTKRTTFRPECEYRFALRLGHPLADTFRLEVSQALFRLTGRRCFGERWWKD